MSIREDIKEHLRARLSQGEFLANLLHVAKNQSTDVQSDFISTLSDVAATVRELLENNGLLGRLQYRPAEFWPSRKGTSYTFIDAGVAKLDLPSAAPLGIRVGRYTVRPGDTGETREEFKIELSLVDDLYSSGVFDDSFDDIAKLTDAARIASEISTAFKCAREQKGITAVLLHGPLVNPAAPYGLRSFPPFGIDAYRELIGDDAADADDDERHFVATYLRILLSLRDTGVPVFGVVERALGKGAVLLGRVLEVLQERGLLSPASVRRFEQEIEPYGLNDANLFDVVLREGEYLQPLTVNRQGPERKWPDNWTSRIRAYPHPLTTYLKPTEAILPFRIETFEGVGDLDQHLDLIFHTSRLLPSYAFPVGLDIVDKYAKVPAWMSRGVKGQHQVVLLRKALESGDPQIIAFAKRVVTAKGRDWLFRPQA